MDMSHGLPFETPMKIYAGEYEDIADCAIVIITAGANQKPDETRLDLVAKNVGIYKHIIPELGVLAAKCFAHRIQSGGHSHLYRFKIIRVSRKTVSLAPEPYWIPHV